MVSTDILKSLYTPGEFQELLLHTQGTTLEVCAHNLQSCVHTVLTDFSYYYHFSRFFHAKVKSL